MRPNFSSPSSSQSEKWISFVQWPFSFVYLSLFSTRRKIFIILTFNSKNKVAIFFSFNSVSLIIFISFTTNYCLFCLSATKTVCDWPIRNFLMIIIIVVTKITLIYVLPAFPVIFCVPFYYYYFFTINISFIIILFNTYASYVRFNEEIKVYFDELMVKN